MYIAIENNLVQQEVICYHVTYVLYVLKVQRRHY